MSAADLARDALPNARSPGTSPPRRPGREERKAVQERFGVAISRGDRLARTTLVREVTSQARAQDPWPARRSRGQSSRCQWRRS